jgi:retron-type reverse transcriptase
VTKKDFSEIFQLSERTIDYLVLTKQIPFFRVAKMYFDPRVVCYFHPESYGYRLGKSAIEAVGVASKRCWRYDWAVDLDTKGFFDFIDHGLLMRAVGKHTDNRWLLLFIERWQKAPVHEEDGTLCSRGKGSTQGSVMSP